MNDQAKETAMNQTEIVKQLGTKVGVPTGSTIGAIFIAAQLWFVPAHEEAMEKIEGAEQRIEQLAEKINDVHREESIDRQNISNNGENINRIYETLGQINAKVDRLLTAD